MQARTGNNYWKTRRRLSRRRMLAGAAGLAGLGAAGIALARCGGGSDGSKSARPATNPDNASAPQPQKGGTFRSGEGVTRGWDTFDADRTRFTPVGTILGYTNLGLLHYKSYTNNELEGAFASKWEQPDPLTFNLNIRENLYWHDKPPVNGRSATADDVVHFINRNKTATLRDGTADREHFYRTEEYAEIDSVRAVDPLTVTVRFKRPNALFETTLAAGYSKVQAPEAVEKFEADYANPRAEQIIGNGGYVLKSFNANGTYTFEPFDKFHGERWIERIEYTPLLTDRAALQAGFESKDFDTFRPRTPALIQQLKATYAGQIYDLTSYAINPIGGSHFRGSPPWNNENLIGAILRTLDRRQLVQDLFRGNGEISGNIPPAQQAFRIPEKELVTMPGYLPNHDDDLAEARKMWEAGGGPALGGVVVDIPDLWEGVFSGVTDVMLSMLRANLEGSWAASVEEYATISEKLHKRMYGSGRNNIWFGWFTDVGKPDPSIELWRVYNSASSQFSIVGGMKLDRVNELTNKLLSELRTPKREEICRDIDRELLKHYGAGVGYLVNQVDTTLYWNYYHIGEAVGFGTAHQFATQHWYDQDDPTWKGRP